MTQTPTQSDRDVVEALLSAVRSNKSAGQTDVEATDYDWNAPCRFVPAQLEALGRFAEEAAGKISGALGRLLRMELEFASAGVTQHFAGRLRDQKPEGKEYGTELRQDDRPCGLIALSGEHAVAWVARLLGGTGPPGETERELSALESRILLDVLGAIVSAFSEAAQARGGGTFTRGETVFAEDYPLLGGEAEEYCRLAFAPAGDEAKAGLSLVVRGDALEPLAGADSAAPGKSPDQMRADMEAHIGWAPVWADVWLGRAQVPMRQVMALEVGDVLLIQKRIGEPVNLLVQGQRVSSGLPVTSGGKYAFQVTSPAGTL